MQEPCSPINKPSGTQAKGPATVVPKVKHAAVYQGAPKAPSKLSQVGRLGKGALIDGQISVVTR